MPDLLEQLRTYGEAVEVEAVRMAERDPVVVRPRWRRQPIVLIAAAVLVVALATGGVAMRLVRANERSKVVATIPKGAPSVDSAPTTTVAGSESAPTTTTSAPADAGVVPSSTTTTSTTSVLGRAPGVAPSATTTTTDLSAYPSAATSTTITTSPTTPTSIATVQSPVIRGTATWIGRDARGTLGVGACPVAQTDAGCPEWRKADVDPDGSFELVLSPGSTPRDWKVLAYVSIFEPPYTCVFNCAWRNVTTGPATTVSDAAPPEALNLSVTARVVDLVVRDRNNQPFPNASVMVSDNPCTQPTCPKFFHRPATIAEVIRIVVDPNVQYEIVGMATDTGWPNPQFTTSDGSKWWSSPSLVAFGKDIPERHTFLVNGAPA